MKIPYTFLEVEFIENEYDQQVPISVIVENVNKDFHNGQQIRNVNSIRYVINQVNNNDEWLQRLEDKWLTKI